MRTVTIFLIFLMAMLGGCKMEHNSRIKQSQLLGEIKTIEAVTRVEVAACNDYQDKTKPSDSLVKTNDLMKSLFPDSEFEGCKNENMNSIATYTTSVDVGSFPPGTKEYEPKGISIIRNEHGIVFFFLSKEIRAKIADGRKNAMTQGLSLNVNIRFSNDTEKEAKIFPYAVFVNGAPYAGLPGWGGHLIVKTKETANFTLSDVASEYAIIHGIVPVFNEPVAVPGDEKK